MSTVAKRAVEHAGVRVVEVRRTEDLAAHREAWRRLAATAGYGEWFAGPEWMEPLFRVYFSHETVAVQFVYRNDELVGVVPFVTRTSGTSGCARSHDTPTNSHVRRIGLLASIQPAELLAILLPDMLRTRSVSCLGMRQLVVGGEAEQALRQATQQTGLVAFSTEETSSAIVSFENGWEAYVASRTPQQLSNLKKRRKLDKAGRWHIATYSTPQALPVGWDALLAIETGSWKHANGTSIANEPGANDFYLSVAQQAAKSGMLELSVLWIDDQPVAHAFCVRHRDTLYLLKNSYKDTFRQLAPGWLLVWEVMQRSAVNGCTRFDLLGDLMPWKLDVATQIVAHRSHLVFAPSQIRCQLCRLTENVIKPAARRLGVRRRRRTPVE